MTKDEVVQNLSQYSSERNLAGMARFGIDPQNGIGVGMVPIRNLAKQIKKDDELSNELWDSDIHELKILAVLIRDKKNFSFELADKWVEDLYSWDICDQFCMNLVVNLDFTDHLIRKWVQDEREFVRRAGFASIASSAVHKKKWGDSIFIEYLEICSKYSTDERNFVKKAVNWAIRQVGKRNMQLRDAALSVSQYILYEFDDSKSARWIANDAIRELNQPETIERIRKKQKSSHK